MLLLIMNKLEKFLTFDSIRFLKLLEMVQYAIIGLLLGFINGLFISNYILVPFKESNYVTERYNREEYNRNPKLWLHLAWDVLIITVTTYYLKKLAGIFPFIFGSINKKYIPGLKNEGTVGVTLGLGFIYLRVLKNFQKRLDLLITPLDEI